MPASSIVIGKLFTLLLTPECPMGTLMTLSLIPAILVVGNLTILINNRLVSIRLSSISCNFKASGIFSHSNPLATAIFGIVNLDIDVNHA
jgi:hypothetical protein